jgi:DNA-binding NtrC family response regulator
MMVDGMHNWTETNEEPLRVLVIDDEHLMRWSIAQRLRMMDYRVVEVGNARDAIAAAKRDAFNMIVVDPCLPDCDEFSFLTNLRLLAPNSGILVISSHADHWEFLTQALKHGATEVLSKPCDLDRLCEAVTAGADGGPLRTQAVPVDRRANFFG